jgi:hypothetical protein
MTDEPRKQHRVPAQHVTVLKVQGAAALIEWIDKHGILHRAYIPAEEIAGDTVQVEALSAAQPYGVPWEDFTVHAITGEQLAQALHLAGIWTASDLALKRSAALGALQSIYGAELGALGTFARSTTVKEE